MEKFTDQYFTYRQTPVSYDGIGNITRIKGNTLVWNQLVNTDTSSITLTSGHKFITKVGGIYSLVNGTGQSLSVTGGTDEAFDLTIMFGSGNEPTLSEFTSLFPLPYYSYDSGSLLSFMGSGIKTTGKNLVFKILPSANLGGDGTIVVDNQNIYDLAVAEVVGGKQYHIGNNRGDSALIGWFTSEPQIGSTTYDGQRIVGSSLIPIAPITGYIVFRIDKPFAKPTFNLGTASIDYEPYKESSLSLPISQYFPTGMKSAGSVYDELTPSKAITRIGSRAYQSGDESNTSVITDGTNTYYALTTPTEQNVDLRLMFSSYANGTEQLLPTSDTTLFLGDIEYYNGTEGETNIRKFWLINGENERWDLTEKEFKAFLNNPQGLGFRKTVESVRYGERQNKVSETYNFPQPQGELLFYDSYNSTRYDKYNKFIRFLMNQPITLYYMIPVSYISGIANIYTLDCEVTEVQKTESKTDNILRSSIVFNGMEFYKGDPITVNGTGTSYTLTNDGDFPVGFEITVEGNLTNPYVTLSQDGELYGEAKFDSETAFSNVYVNSNDGEQNVVLMQNDAIIPNPLSYQDLSISNGSIYVTFVKLARGESTLEIGMESGSLTSVKIEFTPMYRSV